MEKRLHEARPSGTRSNPPVNEIHPRPRVEGRAREGALDRRSKAGPTHLPRNPLEPRTATFTGGGTPYCRVLGSLSSYQFFTWNNRYSTSGNSFISGGITRTSRGVKITMSSSWRRNASNCSN